MGLDSSQFTAKRICTHKECGSFEQKHLVRIQNTGKVCQVDFYLLYVRNELINNRGPSLE